MSTPSPTQILKLYKDLLRYGHQLQFTNTQYFCKRIRKEFKKNKALTNEKEIVFNYKKGIALLKRQSVI